MNYGLILDQVQNHVALTYKLHTSPGLLYHNSRHAERVVQAATQIAKHYELNDRDFFVLITAAWFHDIGYMDQSVGHEEKSAADAAIFLAALQVEKSDIDAITNCIMATKLPQHPNNLLEQIICDADLFDLGTDAFTENNKQIRKEAKELLGKDVSKEEWRAETIALLQQHQYFTDYCRSILDAKKQENLGVLLSKQNKNENRESHIEQDISQPATQQPKKLPKKERPERGVETMFRISSSNQQRLSEMADNKSHILITVNSIIISVVVSLLLRKLDANEYLTIPSIILLLVSLITIVISILSTRPHIPAGRFTKADVDQKKANLMFFGNFYKENLETYTDAMNRLMGDKEYLYNSLIQNLHSHGVVLGRKYKLLRTAYSIFMYGLVIAVIAFIVATLLATTV